MNNLENAGKITDYERAQYNEYQDELVVVEEEEVQLPNFLGKVNMNPQNRDQFYMT